MVVVSAAFFSEIIGSPEIPAEKANLAVDILFQEQRSVRPREPAIYRKGCSASNGCRLTGSLAARLEAPDRAVNDDEIMDICGVSIALAIDMRKTPLVSTF